ncbi:DUF2786 domain-containing protein [Ignavigranum ruoffiae]|uniref:DUF2786 domain-containing protein n=1 Tax=Ignavigranum ruoffiae TaxID=89093 RepID=UPI0024ADCBAD|nr:DUF2786 domain-containing protein [Ignavigranum ruoffiae]
MSENDKILAKIQNLLTLAQDGGDDEESQTALTMAQKLMLKYKISKNELKGQGQDKIIIKSLSVYKRIYWWEKVLVRIIADNFRVMFYIQSSRLPHQKSVQRKLVFMGYPEDVELAYEVFHLAADTMKHYASQHLKGNEDDASASAIRKSYYQGFMDGLENKFNQQKDEMIQENQKYALIIKTPNEVVEKFNQEINGSLSFRHPRFSKNNQAYQDGYSRGTKLEIHKGYLE